MKTAGLYILTLVTGGQFAFPWIFLMANQVSRENSRLMPSLKIKAVVFFSVYAFYVGFFSYGVYQAFHTESSNLLLLEPIVFVLLTSIAIGLFWFSCSLLIKIVTFVRSQSIDLPSDVALIALFFLYCIGFPLLQNRLNRACQ